MPKAAIQVFILPDDTELATIVMDEDEFLRFPHDGSAIASATDSRRRAHASRLVRRWRLVRGCDEVRDIIMIDPNGGVSERAADAQIESLKAAKMIPMISRGTRTEFLFERYEVEQDKASVIVRGQGKEIVRKAVKELSEMN